MQDSNRFSVAVRYCFEHERAPKILMLLCVAVGIATLLHTVQSMSNFVAYYDEGAIALAVQRLAETGLPQMRPPTGSPNFDPAFPYLTIPEYGLECLWRLPFYLISKVVPYNWGTTSSVVFGLLVLGAIALKSLRTSDPLFPTPLSVGLFILLFCVSPYSATHFHYLRYYPLLLVVMAASHLLASSAFVGGLTRQRTPLAVLGFGVLPAFFHLTAVAYFGFWTTMFVGLGLRNARHLGGLQKIAFAVVVAISACAMAVLLWTFSAFLKVGFEPKIFTWFFWLNSSDPLQLGLLLLVAAAGAVARGALSNIAAEGYARLGSQVDSRGFVRATSGETFTGNLASFCQALALYPNSQVAFFKVRPAALEPPLRDRLAPFLNVTAKAADIQRDVCSARDAEKSK